MCIISFKNSKSLQLLTYENSQMKVKIYPDKKLYPHVLENF